MERRRFLQVLAGLPLIGPLFKMAPVGPETPIGPAKDFTPLASMDKPQFCQADLGKICYLDNDGRITLTNDGATPRLPLGFVRYVDDKGNADIIVTQAEATELWDGTNLMVMPGHQRAVFKVMA